MSKNICTFLFCGVSIMLQADPFSFKEINTIEDFELVKPQFLQASDGTDLAFYEFANQDAKDVVILYAGAGFYGNKTYQWVAKTLYEKYKIGCYIFDIRGHGNSKGVRADAPSIDRVLLDVTQAVAYVKKQHKEAKVYLAGHSSGAGLIINYAAQEKNKLEDGYIFIAPYLGPKSGVLKEHKDQSKNFAKKVRTWLYILGAIFPKSFFIHWNAVFFNYPDWLFKQDSLILSTYTFVMSSATTPYEAQELIAQIDKPTALFVAGQDEQFIAEKLLAYSELIKAPVQAKIVDEATHLSILLDSPQLIHDFLINKK